MHKLFWEDPYKKECDSTITKVDGNKIWLDQTVFFAFSGGQSSDSGTINDVSVKEAVEENGEIYYILEEDKTFLVGEKVHVSIDMDQRMKTMRLHSAAHIVYYIVIEKIGKVPLIGSNVSPEKSRIDFLYEKNISDFLPELESKANGLIDKDLEMKTYNDPEKSGRRFWEMEGFERMPCGGTHLKNTKEIGKIKLKRKNLGAGKERVEITLPDL